MKNIIYKILPLFCLGLLSVSLEAKVAVVVATGATFEEAQIRGIFLSKGSKDNIAYETEQGGARDHFYEKSLQKSPATVLATRKQLELTGRAKNKVEIVGTNVEVCQKVAASANAVGIVEPENACQGVAGVKVLYSY